MLDIFNQDAFSVVTMTDALQEVKYKPTYITSLGLFSSESIDTLSIAIEKQDDESLILVPASPRGSPGATSGSTRPNLRNLRVPHYQVDDAIMADRVQGARAFGEERAVMSLQNFIAGRARKARQSFELTAEYQKLALITQGKLLDADGSTLYNYYTEMSESQASEIDLDLDNASPAKGVLRSACEDIQEAIATELDGIPYDGILAICGKNAWKDLTKHKEVYDIYIGWSGATSLQKSTVGSNNVSAVSGIWSSMEVFDIRWVRYRGGQSVNVDDDKIYFVPFGVPDLFKSVYAPADYIETVNTNGQELYAKQWVMPNGKGVNLEFQTNVLHYCTRPRVLRRARRT